MFLRGRSPLIWLIIAVCIVVVLLVRYPLGSKPSLLLTPALQALQAPGQWWQSVSLWFQGRQSLQKAYLTAQQQAEKQASLIQETNSLREENRQLKAILGITNIPGYDWHAAKIRGRSPDHMSQHLVVQTNDADVDDVIVSSEGLVGLVDAVQGQFATVRTILDASIAVPVTLPGTTIAGLLRGQGDTMEVDFILSDEAPAVGAVLYTSGAGGLFPPGIAVARITGVRPLPGQVFAGIEAEPVAHWKRDNWLAIASHSTAP